MSYARWGVAGSRYYIFWMTSEAQRPEEEVLAIWHETYRGHGLGVDFTYQEVKTMLERNDFSVIRGFFPEDQDFLRPRLQEFIFDVDKSYEEKTDSPFLGG